MNVLTKAGWDVVRLGLLAGAIVFAGVGIGQESQPASASHTQVLLSYSNVSPIHASTIVVSPDGIARDVYAWVVNVDNATGVSSYHLEIGFDSSVFTATSIETPLPLWLGTSGRSPSCPSPTIATNRAYIDCVTIGQVPPYGATGTGIIGRLTIQPGPGPESSPLDLTGTSLGDTPIDPDDFTTIPVTLLSSVVVYIDCADVNGDGIVDLLNDILGIIQRYQWTPENHPDDWDPAYDINNDGVIDLLNDILGAVMQYQLPCTQTP